MWGVIVTTATWGVVGLPPPLEEGSPEAASPDTARFASWWTSFAKGIGTVSLGARIRSGFAGWRQEKERPLSAAGSSALCPLLFAFVVPPGEAPGPPSSAHGHLIEGGAPARPRSRRRQGAPPSAGFATRSLCPVARLCSVPFAPPKRAGLLSGFMSLTPPSSPLLPPHPPNFATTLTMLS